VFEKRKDLIEMGDYTFPGIIDHCVYGPVNLDQKGFNEVGLITLRCGRKSEWYCDVKSAFLDNTTSFELVHLASKKIESEFPGFPDRVQVLGIGYGGSILVSSLPMSYNKLVIRDYKKEHGMKNSVIGKVVHNDVIIVEDVITSGDSTLAAIEVAKELGLAVKGVFVVVNRHYEIFGKIREELRGLRIHPLYYGEEIIDLLDHKYSGRKKY
jgi:orotate phosphoribosyltransferase